MEAVMKTEMRTVLERAERLSKEGRYGKAIAVLDEFVKKINSSNISFSFWDDLLCWEVSGDCGETCGEMGVGGCCCCTLLLVLAGWGSACVCPAECGCCGECSSEFYKLCICGFGKDVGGLCLELCCCCYW